MMNEPDISPEKLCGIIKYFFDAYGINVRDTNGRYFSWKYCFKAFEDINANEDFLALHLGFYLASWGMYRGSSILLQKDYTIHKKAVEIVNQYHANLYRVAAPPSKEISAIYGELYGKLESVYTIDGRTPSDTLITKIMLGTLGCIPAFDRFFKAGARRVRFGANVCLPHFVTQSNIGETAEILSEYYRENKDCFEKCAAHTGDLAACPPMKFLDLGIWCVGFYESVAASGRQIKNANTRVFAEKVKREVFGGE